MVWLDWRTVCVIMLCVPVVRVYRLLRFVVGKVGVEGFWVVGDGGILLLFRGILIY
jgi:hypothetical protein